MNDDAANGSGVPEKRGGVPTGYLVRLIVTLTAVCAVISLLLSTVNAVTKDRISAHKLEAQNAAVFEVFPEGDKCEFYSPDGTDEGVYLVFRGGELAGYAARVTPSGFGGEIEMMVGVGADGTTTGVSIISMSETAGVGSKVKADSFLEQFRGKDGKIAVGDGIDGITGATISSKAVTEGVRQAHSLGIDLQSIARERGISLYGGGPVPTEPESDEPESQPEESSEPPESESESESESSSVESETPFSESANGGGGGAVEVDVTETDDQYEIEIDKDTYESELNDPDEPVEPQPTEPEPTEPEPTEPQPTEPEPTQPITTDTTPVVPVTSESKDTEPVASSSEEQSEPPESSEETESEPEETDPPESESEPEESESEGQEESDSGETTPGETEPESGDDGGDGPAGGN